MNIALLDVDGHHFPNLALMKLARWHKTHGDSVEFYDPLFGRYDRLYMSKVFTHTYDYAFPVTNACEIIRGGTGYDITTRLPHEIDHMQPDYSLYSNLIDSHTAYGFLTRGCINACPWCVVPRKEGLIQPYMDVDEIAIEGRDRLILMDNNILACDYGLAQLDKIASRGYRVDFNQAMDARLVTDEAAALIARIRFQPFIRFGCDTRAQVVACATAMERIDYHSGRHRQYLLYTMIHGSIQECYERISFWRQPQYLSYVRCQSQPMLDFSKTQQRIPQWQRDMARWSNCRKIYGSTDFKSYMPRKGFICEKYF